MLDAEFQEFIKKHPDLRPLFERVTASSRSRAFWRVKGEHKLSRENRSEALVRAEITFAEAAMRKMGAKGYDEGGIPIVAAETKRHMKGRRFEGKKKPVSRFDQVLEKLAKLGVLHA